MGNKLTSAGKKADKTIVLIGIGFGMVALIAGSLDVITRAAVGSMFAWAQKLAIWSTITSAVLLAGNQVLEKAHIAIDILFKQLKGTLSKIVAIINAFAMTAFVILMLSGSIAYTLALKSRGITRTFGNVYLPYWTVIISILGVGSFIFTIYCIVRLWQVIKSPPENSKGGELE
jgi:TRAP-type C4-dicarboxylate transport system permease small subunit